MDTEDSERDRGEASQRGPDGRAPSARELALRAELLYLRQELENLLETLDHVAEVAPSSAVVTAVVPKTVLLHQPSRRS